MATCTGVVVAYYFDCDTSRVCNSGSLQKKQTTATETRSGAILKRLIVNVLGRTDLAPTSATSWLQALDEMSGTIEFTQGAGAVFGGSRYSRNPPEVDLSELHKLVISLVSRIKIHKKYEPKSRITND